MPKPYSEDFSPDALDPRIVIHEAPMIVEITFAGLYFHTTTDVNAFYDRIEERLLETGEPLWFFLVNTQDYRIDGDAWFAFTRRGRDLNEAHSMGTMRFDADPQTIAQIERNRGTDRAVSNLFPSRDTAWDHLRGLPSNRLDRPNHVPNYHKAEFVHRFTFDPANEVMEIDLSGVTFEHSRDVNDIHNWIEEAMRPSHHRWYLLYNYEGTRIDPAAWVHFTARNQHLNAAYALGAARYAPDSETEADIRLRYEAKAARPNIRNTRAEALARIQELKAERPDPDMELGPAMQAPVSRRPAPRRGPRRFPHRPTIRIMPGDSET